MIKNLLLHIGTEKTGTTSIQKLLYVNKEALCAGGLHILQAGGMYNNRGLATACMDYSNVDDAMMRLGLLSASARDLYTESIRRDLSQEIESLPDHIHTVIASSEHFHSRTRDESEIEKVRALFSPYFENISILCYLREQSQLLSSSYSTEVKWHSPSSPEDYYMQCHLDNPFFNYQEFLGRWENIFGFDKMIIRKFEKNRFLDKSLLNNFLQDFLPMNLLDDKIAKNVALTPVGQAVAQAINLAFPALKKAQRIKTTKILEGNFAGVANQLSTQQQQEIYERFRASNALVKKKYLREGGDLFSFTVAPEPTVTLGQEQVEGVKQVLIGLREVGISEEQIDFMRDLAIKLESTQPLDALKLLEIAAESRPQGAFIQRKLMSLREKHDLNRNA